MAGKELGEGERGGIRLWRSERIIQDLEGQSKQVQLYSQCNGQPLGGCRAVLQAGWEGHLIYFALRSTVAFCGELVRVDTGGRSRHRKTR